MATSGSGQVTPIPSYAEVSVPYDPTEELDYLPNCAVSLPRYAKIVGYEEAAFWGVVFENQHWTGCDVLWDESSRMKIGMALGDAQQMVEEILGYPLCPTWIAGKTEEEYRHDNRWVDQQRLRKVGRLLTRYPRLIAAGVRATEVIQTDAEVTHDATFGVVGPLATNAADEDEVVVYYPGSNRRIIPARVSLSGGFVTIHIPRYRMVVQDMLNTPPGGIMYENTSAFLTTVDVRRVYNDPTTQGVLVAPRCSNNACRGGCGECTRSACIYIRDETVGEIDIQPADYDTDTETWIPKRNCAGTWSLARLNYLAGVRFLNLEAEAAVVKLAHTLLTGPPCSCDLLVDIWKADNDIPRVLTRERINNPFGPSNGAWVAYRWAKNQASIRASIF